MSLQAELHGTHVDSAAASGGTRKLDGGRAEQGVSSTSVTDPTPASTMFLATSAARPVQPAMSTRAALSLQGARQHAFDQQVTVGGRRGGSGAWHGGK